MGFDPVLVPSVEQNQQSDQRKAATGYDQEFHVGQPLEFANEFLQANRATLVRDCVGKRDRFKGWQDGRNVRLDDLNFHETFAQFRALI